jgi:TPR repeat protein
MKNRYRYHLILYILASLTLLTTHALAKTTPPEQKATDKGIKLYQNQQYSQALPLLKTGSQKGKAAAHYYLARIYEQGLAIPKDIPQAIKLFKLAAVEKHHLSQTKLGMLHIYGLNVLQDFETGLKYLQQAATKNPEAQFILGTLYLQGLAVEKNLTQAAKWLLKAARSQHLLAQIYTAQNYITGSGLPQNPTKAFYWYKQAANYGNLQAMLELANAYKQGIGTKKDQIQAHIYYNLAAARGSQLAQQQLALLTKDLSLKALIDAQQQAKQWQPKPLVNFE